jgi:RNA-binding protein
MRCHWVRLRATSHPTEVLDRVGDAVQFVSGLDADTFAELTEVSDLESHHGGTVHLVETIVKRQRDIRTVFASIGAGGAKPSELDARTDEDGVFYLRFDKQQAVGKDIVATRSEDAVQVRIKPEVHPSRRENALEALSAWLDEQLAAESDRGDE